MKAEESADGVKMHGAHLSDVLGGRSRQIGEREWGWELCAQGLGRSGVDM